MRGFMNKVKRISAGKWKDIPWEFIIDPVPPNPSLCTAAFCVVMYQEKLILVEHKSRGLEFPGGHIEMNETSEQAVKREVMEEAGAVITDPVYFGYKKISPTKPISHRDQPSKSYPFPHSYIPYYFSKANHLIKDAKLSDDVREIRIITVEEAGEKLSNQNKNDSIIRQLIKMRYI